MAHSLESLYFSSFQVSSAGVAGPFLFFMIEDFKVGGEADVGFWAGIVCECYFERKRETEGGTGESMELDPSPPIPSRTLPQLTSALISLLSSSLHSPSRRLLLLPIPNLSPLVFNRHSSR